MLRKNFYLKTFKDGSQYPIIDIATKEYEMLYELGMYILSKSEGVKKALESLDKVLSGELEKFELSTGDWCVVDVRKSISRISNNFDEFDPIEIPTSEIVKLMNDWLDFLLLYENGKIPGIIPKNKEGELFIVPKEYIKEEFLQDFKNKI